MRRIILKIKVANRLYEHWFLRGSAVPLAVRVHAEDHPQNKVANRLYEHWFLRGSAIPLAVRVHAEDHSCKINVATSHNFYEQVRACSVNASEWFCLLYEYQMCELFLCVHHSQLTWYVKTAAYHSSRAPNCCMRRWELGTALLWNPRRPGGSPEYLQEVALNKWPVYMSCASASD